jgi:hypothetical protein
MPFPSLLRKHYRDFTAKEKANLNP